MDWKLIKKDAPPIEKWLEFYDGENSMSDEVLNHIDKIDKYGHCVENYLHNYTHWRHLSAPKTHNES